MPEAGARHGHRGTRAIQRMVEYAPSTGGLALWVAHRDLPDATVGVALDAAAGAPEHTALHASPAAAISATTPANTPASTPATMTASMAARGVPPIIATDGFVVYYGAAFEALPLPEQTGLVAHEVLHIALRHPQRLTELQQQLGDVDPVLYNTCADAIVNSALGHLGWLQLPARAVTLEQLLDSALGGQHGAEPALLAWDVERLYRAIDDREPARGALATAAASSGSSGQRGTRPGEGTGRRPGADGDVVGEADDTNQGAARTGATTAATATATARHHPGGSGGRPSTADEGGARRLDGPRSSRVRALGAHGIEDLLSGPHTHADPQAQADQAHEWSERLQRAHAGDGAFSMLRALVADLPRTRTPWEQVLRTQLARHLSQRLDVSWSRPSRSYLANQGRCGPHRRMPFEPGLSPRRAVPRLVVVVDVSGSIDDMLLARFTHEVESITRRLEAGVTVVVGDERVRRVEHFEPGRCALRNFEFHGGGGTDFTPLLVEADRHSPELTVVLTDLDGPARFRPRAPVLWAVPEAHARAVAPFGRKLSLI